MVEMTLILHTLSNMLPTECSFPSEMTAREVADDIANQLNYPVIDPETNEPIGFYLVDGNGKRIDDDAKLEDAGLRNGDTIKIQSSKFFVPPPPPEPPQGAAASADGQLSLWVKLLNQHRNVYEQFAPNTRVSDLLTQMIDKYDLPAHYPSSNQPIVYVVQSKTLGRELHGVETLSEARVSNLDTLFINTTNTAGGRYVE